MYVDLYEMTGSMEDTTCLITAVLPLSAPDSCFRTVQILRVNYTIRDETISSVLTTTSSNYYPRNKIVSCSVSTSDKYFVVFKDDSAIKNNFFITGIVLGIIGTVIIIGYVAWNLKKRRELQGNTLKLQVALFKYGLFMLSLIIVGGCVTSLVFLGMKADVWVNYKEGHCNLTNIDYQLDTHSVKQACNSFYTLNETVFIFETQMEGTVVVRNDNHLRAYFSNGRQIGEIYPCYYKQSDVIWNRPLYSPFLVLSIITLILSIWFVYEIVSMNRTKEEDYNKQINESI